MSKYLGKLKRTTSSRSMRSSSSRVSADMQIDVPSPIVEVPQSSLVEKNILLEEKHLKLQNKTEKEAYK